MNVVDAVKQKIGIIAFPFNINYGAVLVAYALRKAVSSLDYDADVIGYDPVNHYQCLSDKNNLFHKFKNLGTTPISALNKMRQMLLIRACDYLFIDKTSEMNRRNKFSIFVEKYLHVFTRIQSEKDLKDELESCGVALIGGDQVWNVDHVGYSLRSENAYFLSYSFRADVRKVSYAPCFGKPSVPQEYTNFIRDSLHKFSSIGVRNEMSKNIVKTISGKDATVNVDPTLLVSFDEITTDSGLGRNMIVFFILKKDLQWSICSAKRLLKSQIHKDILSISVYKRWLFSDYWADSLGPCEWLGVFKNASYIVTDSFHGTIFAIKNRKQFITIVKDPTDVRMTELLRQYGLLDRIVHSSKEVCSELLLNPIDYDSVHNLIDQDVQASYAFLKDSLAR